MGNLGSTWEELFGTPEWGPYALLVRSERPSVAAPALPRTARPSFSSNRCRPASRMLLQLRIDADYLPQFDELLLRATAPEVGWESSYCCMHAQGLPHQLAMPMREPTYAAAGRGGHGHFKRRGRGAAQPSAGAHLAARPPPAGGTLAEPGCARQRHTNRLPSGVWLMRTPSCSTCILPALSAMFAWIWQTDSKAHSQGPCSAHTPRILCPNADALRCFFARRPECSVARLPQPGLGRVRSVEHLLRPAAGQHQPRRVCHCCPAPLTEVCG